MPTDWSEEWSVLIAAERLAFDNMLNAQNKLTEIFSRVGAPDMALMDEVDAKRKEWKVRESAVQNFLARFRASDGT